jgi:hypothetical protein
VRVYEASRAQVVHFNAHLMINLFALFKHRQMNYDFLVQLLHFTSCTLTFKLHYQVESHDLVFCCVISNNVSSRT